MKYTDDAYITMFVKEHSLLVIERDEHGDIKTFTDENDNTIPVGRQLTDEEKLRMQAGKDEK